MASFATVEDVQTRLGRDLTGDEQAQVQAVLDGVSGLVREAVDKAYNWDPAVVPATFTVVCIEKALSVVSNPESLAAESKRLGQLEHSQTFRRLSEGGLVYLTAEEERRCRRALYGTNTASYKPESLADEVADLIYLDDVCS